MKAVGLITEYNPLHNGHMLHLKKSLELTGADVAIAVMSGNFVQRGEPAVTDKYTRARMAVDCGVNLVIELPVGFALGSAEKFATGGILALQALQADSVCFGSEAGNIRRLAEIADVLASEPDKYQLALKKELKTGVSFPVARENAIASLHIMDSEELHEILSSPNNILAIEYIKAIKRNACAITPYTYKREGMAYNAVFSDDDIDTGDDYGGGYQDYSTLIAGDDIYADDGTTLLASSEAIRHELRRYYSVIDAYSESDDEDLSYEEVLNKTEAIMENVMRFIPDKAKDIFTEALDHKMPVFKDDFNEIFNIKMREIIKEAAYNKKRAVELLCCYEGINSDLANRMINKYDKNYDIGEYIEAVKDKSNTYKAISRAIFRIILDIRDDKADDDIIIQEIDGAKVFDPDLNPAFSISDEVNIGHLRILALDEKGMEYLKSIRKTCEVPIITKTAGEEELIAADVYAADMYNLILWDIYGENMQNEFQKGIYIKGRGFTGSDEKL